MRSAARAVETRVSHSGFCTFDQAPKKKANWAGEYLVGFDHGSAEDGTRAWAGIGTGTVTADGTLKLAGVLADGAAFTAALPAGPNRQYVAFLNPYRKPGSFIAGKVRLESRRPDPGLRQCRRTMAFRIGDGGSRCRPAPTSLTQD